MANKDKNRRQMGKGKGKQLTPEQLEMLKKQFAEHEASSRDFLKTTNETFSVFKKLFGFSDLIEETGEEE